MRIRNEWYDSDVAAAEEKREEQEAAMQPNKAEGEYGKVSIQSKLGGRDMK